jgi:hypothetical protein
VVELNRKLERDYGEYIREQRAVNTPTSAIIDTIKLRGASATSSEGGPGTSDPPEREGGAETLGAKRGQVVRALNDPSFTQMEAKWLPRLRDSTGEQKDTLALFDDGFTGDTVLPKAVLLASPGVRLTSYCTDSDFMDLLKDEAGGLGYWLGQCVAYDEDEEEVPDGLETYVLDAPNVMLTRTFKWEQIKPLEIALAVRSKQTTAQFATHDHGKLYHVAHGIELATGIMVKYYKGLGFRDDVPAARGWAYPTFMKKIKRLNAATIGMEASAAKGMHAFVDRCVQNATVAAASSYRRTVYGASPADKEVGAWLPSSDPTFMEMVSALDAIKKMNTFAIALPGVYGGGAAAATIPGLGAGAPAPQTVTESEKTSPPNKKKTGAKRRKEAAGKTAAGAAALTNALVTTGGGGTCGGGRGGGGGGGGGGTGGGGADSQSTHAGRLKLNPKCIFYYDDGKYSAGPWLVDFPGICAKYKWDPHKLCGPVTMTTVTKKCRDFDCMNAAHRCANSPPKAREREPTPAERRTAVKQSYWCGVARPVCDGANGHGQRTWSG